MRKIDIEIEECISAINSPLESESTKQKAKQRLKKLENSGEYP